MELAYSFGHIIVDAWSMRAYYMQAIMMAKKSKITFHIHRCKGCGLCVSACPRGNIRMSEALGTDGYPYAELIDPAKCNRCGLCYQMCPDAAIEIPEEPGEED